MAKYIKVGATERTCKGCKNRLPAKAFRLTPGGRLRCRCRKCEYPETGKYRPEGYQRAYQLRRNYKMTLADYDRMLEYQNYSCAICGVDHRDVPKRFHVDHDHLCCPGPRTCGKCVRGLLCNDCNTALGYLEKPPSWVADARAYIERHKKP